MKIVFNSSCFSSWFKYEIVKNKYISINLFFSSKSTHFAILPIDFNTAILWYECDDLWMDHYLFADCFLSGYDSVYGIYVYVNALCNIDELMSGQRLQQWKSINKQCETHLQHNVYSIRYLVICRIWVYCNWVRHKRTIVRI